MFMFKALKEEIRIYQRSEERHKHIENLEYVKNIILKVIRINNKIFFCSIFLRYFYFYSENPTYCIVILCLVCDPVGGGDEDA